MRSSIIITIFLLFFSCKSKPDLHELVNSAISNKDTLVVIPDGKYVLNKPIVLKGVKNLHIKGENAKGVTITSSMVVPVEDLVIVDESMGLYEYTDPKLKLSPWPDAFKGYAGWPEVYIDGEPLEMARYPNEGFIKADSIIYGERKPKGKNEKQLPARFISEELAKNHNNKIPLFLNGYWKVKWADEIIRVDSINTQSGEVIMAAPHNYGMGDPSGGLFYAINQPDYIDNENEYYFNSEKGTIRFLHSFSKEEKSITIAYQDFTLFDISNSDKISFENLEFNYHNNLAFNISESKNVVIDNCKIYGLARSAVKITDGSDCGIKNSVIKYLGGMGILLTGGDKATLSKANHFVENCDISYFSRHVKTYAPAVKLLGVGHIVKGNKMNNAPHNAILFSGNDHLISKNEIRKVCLNTSDAGAIYCGRDWTMGGTVISENDIRDLGQASHHNNWAIYLDDLASGIKVLNNHIEDCPSGILIGGGRYNTINNNTIINCPKRSIRYDARGYSGWFIHHLADSTLSLWPRLRAVPIDQPPWSIRFPWLQDIQDDDAALPRGAEVINNRIKNSAKPMINEKVYEYGEVDIVK